MYQTGHNSKKQLYLRTHYSQITALLEKAELAYSMSNPNREWLNIASQLSDQSNYFEGELKYLLQEKTFNEELFVTLFRSMALCNTGHIECLLLANEMRASYKTAELIGFKYKTLFDPLTPHYLSKKINDTRYKTMEEREINEKTINIIKTLRDITDISLTKPILIDNLIHNKIEGIKYLNAAKSNKNHTILLYRHNN